MPSPAITTTIDERIAELSGRTIPLSSSWITSASYDADTQTLTVQMKMQDYTLTGVPPDVFLAFIDAPSPGSYFNNNLKGLY